MAEEHFERLGDDWDAEERASPRSANSASVTSGLDRTVGEVSGVRVGPAAVGRAVAAAAGLDVPLLDEPTNNLRPVRTGGCTRPSPPGRGSWSWSATTASCWTSSTRSPTRAPARSPGTAGLSAYEEVLAVEQEAAERMVRVAESDLRKQKRELADAQVKLASSQTGTA